MDFFRKPSVSEQLKTQNRELRKTQRDVERSQRDLDKQEKQLEAEIKKAAKEGNKQVCTILAKNLVRLRNQKARTYTVSSQISSIGSKAKLMNANQKMAGAMQTTTKTLKQVNSQVKPAEMMKTLQEFSKQNQLMDMKEELIDDTLESALQSSGDEEEENEVVNKVLDEIGIEIKGKLAQAPSVQRGGLKADASKKTSRLTDSEIEAELAKLKM